MPSQQDMPLLFVDKWIMPALTFRIRGSWKTSIGAELLTSHPDREWKNATAPDTENRLKTPQKIEN